MTANRSNRKVRPAARAGLLVLALGLLTTRGLDSADAAVHLDTALSLVERHDAVLTLDPGPIWVPTRALAGGLLYEGDDGLRSASAPGLAWLALPAVALADLFTPEPRPRFDALFAGGAPRAVVAPLQHDPRVIAFVLLGPLSAALAAAFLVLTARALGLSRPATILAVAALALGSPFFAYAGTSWTQLPTAAALAYLLYRLSAREARPDSGVAGIGVAAAVAILVRPDHLLFVVVAVAVLYRIDRGWRRSPSRSLARVLPLVALACGALSLWGLPANGGGWSLAEVPAGLVGLLFSPRTGLLFYAPFVVLLPLGLTRLPRPIAWLIVGWLLAAILVYAGWFDWGASLAYGPRFFVPLLPALALAFGAAVDALPERRRAWAWLPVVLGFAVELPGALLIHARIPEPERMLHPTFTSAWSTLLGPGAVGPLGVDCVSTYVLAYPIVAALAALAGAWLSRPSRVRPSASRPNRSGA